MLESGFREKRKAGDFVSGVPSHGEPLGLQLSITQGNTLSTSPSKCPNSDSNSTKPYLNGNIGVEGPVFVLSCES